jgi:hypothetical protein
VCRKADLCFGQRRSFTTNIEKTALNENSRRHRSVVIQELGYAHVLSECFPNELRAVSAAFSRIIQHLNAVIIERMERSWS